MKLGKNSFKGFSIDKKEFIVLSIAWVASGHVTNISLVLRVSTQESNKTTDLVDCQ